MIIRKYTKADYNVVIDLFQFNTPQYFAPKEEKDLEEYLDNHAENYFIVEADGIILGCGGFNLSEDGTLGKISWDIFHPNNQGKGYGTALTKYRIDKMKEIDSVKIISVRTSQMAYRFYAKFNLELREVIKDYWAPGFDLYRLDNSVNNVN